MDLVGTVGDAQRAGEGPHAGERGVVGDARATVDLDRLVEHPQSGARAATTLIAEISRRAARLPTVSISQAVLSTSSRACSIRQRALGDPVLDDSLVAERSAEGGPLLGPGDHQVEGPLRHADGPHAVVDAARPEPGLGDHVAVALVGEQVRDGHPDVVEADLAVPAAVLVAEDGERRARPSTPGASIGTRIIE